MPRVAPELVQVYPVARGVHGLVLLPGLGLRVARGGLICVFLIGGESASVSYRGVGGGETWCGHGDYHEGDDPSLVRMAIVCYVRIGSEMALWLRCL